MTLPADVEAVIITYQSEGHLSACLAPLGSERVLVLDNASTDHSIEVAGEAGVRVVANTHNTGFARAVNHAMRLTTAPFVLFVNPDAVVQPQCVENLRRAMTNPTIGVAASRLVHPDGSEQRAAWPFPSPRAQWAEAFGLHRHGLKRGGGAEAESVDSVVGACMLIRRDAFTAVGGFDERFWLYGEETDFCRRLETAGWRRVVPPDAIAIHEGGASGAGSAAVAQHFFHGSDRFVLHHHGRLALASSRSALLLGSLLRLPLLALRRPSDPRVRTRLRAIRHCLRQLVRRPFSVPTVPLEGDEEVVLCSLEACDTTWRRNQLFVERLTAANPSLRLLFVEPPLDVVHRIRSERRVSRRANALPHPQPGLPGVYTFQPLKVLPRVLGPWADRSLMRQVHRAARNVGITRPVLWLNDSVYAPLLRRRQAWPCLYDITDDWLAEQVPPRERRRREAREQLLLDRAREVVVCSPALAERRGARRKVSLVSNAVDTKFFQTPQQRPAQIPPSPVALYVGTLQRERIDLALVRECAVALPTTQLVLVGPIALSEAERSSLDAHPNVHMIGPRPYSEVPAWLQHADVMIVPHVVSAFTDSLDPIKLYECRAVGIPTLATPVAGFRDCQWPTVLTAPASEFPQQLGALLEQRNVPMPDPDTPTWHGQAQQFHELLQRARAGNERLKVVFLGHTAKQSGGELALVRLLEGFTDVNAHVILAEDGPLVALLHSAGATTEVLPLGGATLNAHRGSVTLRHLPLRKVFSTLRYSVALTRRLQSLQPDLVHTNTLKAAIYGGVAGRLARIPVVWHVRDRIANDYLPPFATKLVRTLSRLLPSGIIANSNATLATLGRRPRRARVVPSPVVYDAVPAKAFSSNAAAVQPEELRIGLIGRISPWKGHDVFLRAFAAADFPVPATALLVGSAMFGEDAYEAELHQLCADLGIADRVQFTGFVADVPSVLATLHIVVHASTIPEPFGQVVVEGMAAGLPVIAANAGGPAEIVTHGVDGLLTPPGDVKALTAALELLAADPALRARLGAAGRARAANFSPEHVAGMVTTVYRSVLASTA